MLHLEKVTGVTPYRLTRRVKCKAGERVVVIELYKIEFVFDMVSSVGRDNNNQEGEEEEEAGSRLLLVP